LDEFFAITKEMITKQREKFKRKEAAVA